MNETDYTNVSIENEIRVKARRKCFGSDRTIQINNWNGPLVDVYNTWFPRKERVLMSAEEKESKRKAYYAKYSQRSEVKERQREKDRARYHRLHPEAKYNKKS